MIPPIDPAALSAPALRLTTAPLKMQELAASKAIAPGVGPADMLALLVFFSRSATETVQKAAAATLKAVPEPILQGALGAPSPLAPAVIDALVSSYADRFEIVERLLGMPTIAPDTVEELARTGDERLTELIATNEARLLEHPRIIERLYMNKLTRSSTADRLVDLAVRNKVELPGIAAFKEAALAIENELIAEPSDEPTPDDLMFREAQEVAEEIAAKTSADEDTHDEDEEGAENLKAKFLPLYMQVANMTMSQKIRSAILGTREMRMLLVRDRNRLVQSAAVRSPLMQENEAVLIAKNRNSAEEVLRIIGTTPEWMKSYQIKRSLVENPKTPVAVATRLVTQLRESDLRAVAKSKNVTGPVKDAARRHLDRRNS
ncbi:MAG TPA: hypothetical protein VGM56_07875 [Byssovorax sp.]|jgi:hypothetical protein